MKELTQKQVFDYLFNNGIENFVGVPDSTMKYFIDQGFKKNKILITTKEEEAIGIAAGMSLSKSDSLVFMQNAGFANSLSTITSLVQLYQIPMIFLIGWRGFLKNDAPEHTKIGKIQPKLLQTLSLQSKILNEKNWKPTCDWALKLIKEQKLDICFVQETFLKNNDGAKISEIQDYGMTIHSCPRTFRGYGGLAIIQRPGIKLKVNTKINKYFLYYLR